MDSDYLDIKSRTIYVSCTREELDCISHETSLSVVRDLDILDRINHKPITMKLISCNGGDFTDCLSIYSAMRLCKSPITVIGYGYVCSSGTIIMQAASHRVLTKECEFMIHYGSLAFDQPVVSAKSMIKWSNRSSKLMLDIYAAKCANGTFFTERNYSVSRTRKYLDTKMRSEGDVWLTPDEALEYGFIDEII